MPGRRHTGKVRSQAMGMFAQRKPFAHRWAPRKEARLRQEVPRRGRRPGSTGSRAEQIVDTPAMQPGASRTRRGRPLTRASTRRSALREVVMTHAPSRNSMRVDRLNCPPALLATLDRPFAIERPDELRGFATGVPARAEYYVSGTRPGRGSGSSSCGWGLLPPYARTARRDRELSEGGATDGFPGGGKVVQMAVEPVDASGPPAR